MCGILGYIGTRDASPILFNGLKRLEYRGYDSCGIAMLYNNEIIIRKDIGKIDEVNSKVDLKKIPGNLGITHTRWATTGIVTKANAHPHHNQTKTIALVHNGIIENYALLKKRLQEAGYQFYSETDSEVLTNLIDYHYNKEKQTNQNPSFKKALVKALHDVVGAYGIVILHQGKNKLYAARKGSPLCLGIGQDKETNQKEFFVASDPAAFLEHTKRVLYLEDDDIVTIDSEKFEISNLCEGHENCVHRTINNIDWELSKIEKNGYEHFMLKEIFEQSESLKNCLAGRVDLENATAKITTNFSDDFIKNLKRIIITACGTSWHAALVGKYLIEKYCRIPIEVEFASEFRYKNPILDENDLVIVISQSGETADTLAALKEAKSKRAKTFGFVNVVGSTIAREVDSGIYIHAGPEIGVASTKAFTGQVLSILLFMIYLGRIRKTISPELAKKILENLTKIPDYIKETYTQEKNIKQIALDIFHNKSCFFLGRGVNLPTALEGSLKMKEISYIHSEAFPAAEMKHGPIALLEPGFPVIAIAPNNDPIYEKMLSNIQEVKARQAKMVVIANSNDNHISEFANHIIKVPTIPDYLQAIVCSVPLQLLAYYVAKERGCEIDQPRNLAKSVTVE